MNFNKLLFSALICILFSCNSTSKTVESTSSNTNDTISTEQKQDFKKGELIVQIKSEDYEHTIDQISLIKGVSFNKIISQKRTTFILVNVPKDKEQKYIEIIKKQDQVTAVELNYTVTIFED